MCYSGKCAYEDSMGNCKLILSDGEYPPCPEDIYDEIENLKYRVSIFRLSYDNVREIYE